jgi:hypothetical protein
MLAQRKRYASTTQRNHNASATQPLRNRDATATQTQRNRNVSGYANAMQPQCKRNATAMQTQRKREQQKIRLNTTLKPHLLKRRELIFPHILASWHRKQQQLARTRADREREKVK